MDAQEFITLYRKFLSGNCTPQEIKLIEKHENEFELHDVPWKPEMGNKQQVKQVIKSSLKSIIDKPAAKKTSFKYWMAAALFAVALSVGILLNQNNKKSNAESVKGKRSYAVVPGCNKALLTLADGSTIDLDDSKKGLLSNQGGVSVGKAKNGEVIYQMKKLDSHSTVALFNTITTPRGGQYQIVLSDGTKVWLNAASSLKFPASFSGNQRNVQLTGEAYFEVAKNKAMPFNVAVNNLNIKVLGTHFNVNA
ncbi:MAG TPA: FecR family protein, partial [Segetibacter sp.]